MQGEGGVRLTPVFSQGGRMGLWGGDVMHMAQWRFVDSLSASTPLSLTPYCFSIHKAQRKLAASPTQGREHVTLASSLVHSVSLATFRSVCGLSPVRVAFENVVTMLS